MTLDVLVAEDNEFWQDLHKRIISRPDVNVVIVGDLKSALEVAKEYAANNKKFGLYITDGIYPTDPQDEFVKKGICYDFYQKIKEIDPAAKILLVSGDNYDLSARSDVPDMTFVPKEYDVFRQKIDELLKSAEVKNDI
jgi:DNA-binding Lrp family transcriptional regulator